MGITTERFDRWDDLLPDLIGYLSSSHPDFVRPPDGFIIMKIKQASEDIFTESRLARSTYYADLQCGVDTYPVIMKPNECLMVGVSFVEVLCSSGKYRRIEKSRWIFDGKQTITLLDPPFEDAERGIRITYNYVPCEDDCLVTEELKVPRGRNALMAGTLYYMYAMAHAPWKSVQWSSHWKKEFDKYKIKLKIYGKYRGSISHSNDKGTNMRIVSDYLL